MHKYLIKVYIKTVFGVIYTSTSFDTFVSSSWSYNKCLAKKHSFF